MLAEISHYKVEEQIGKGGMGVVFRAMDTRLNRPVALKFLSEDSLKNEGAKYRLLREARAASALNHGNIATIHEIDDSDDHTFIAMEYVEGETIRDRIERGPLPTTEALNYAAQIADALSEAHSKRIVHRDIKASNVVIKPSGQVKVLDFGLAKIQPAGDMTDDQFSTVSTLTQSGTVVGTVAYMSPEQLRSQELDGRSDIFSLGVVLYEMLSGHKPFERANKIESFGATLHENPKPITEYVSVPPSVIKLIDKCLEKKPENRYQSSADLQKDLLKVKNEIETGSMSLKDRLMRTIRTKRAAQIMTATVVIFLLASVSLAAYTLVTGRFPGTHPPLVNLSGFKRVGVLPVKQLTKKDDESAVLAQALTQSLVTGLSRTNRFTVLTERATEGYRDTDKDEGTIGRELQIDGLMEATLQDNSGHLKITLSLVRCNDRTAIWRKEIDTYDRGLFAVQDQVVGRIGELIGEPEPAAIAQLGQRPSTNQQAYRLYTYGRVLYNKASTPYLLQAVEQYKQALEVEPAFALARAELSITYSQLINYDPQITDPKWLDMADAEAKLALNSDDTLPEAYFAAGRSHYIRYLEFNVGNPAQAIGEIEQSLRLDPHLAEALYMLSVINMYEFYATEDKSYLEHAVDLHNQASEYEPDRFTTEAMMGRSLAYLSRFDEGLDHTARLKVTNPSYTQVHGDLAFIYYLKKDYDQAISEEKRFLELNPNSPTGHAWLAMYLLATGKRTEAIEHLSAAEAANDTDYGIEYCLASVNAGLGRRGQALHHLEKYVELVKSKKVYARVMKYTIDRDPNLDQLRNDAEFVTLLGLSIQ